MADIRVVIWDLDNTIWNGTVFYKDKESISLKPGSKEALKELTKRGVVNAICSKNYYEDASSFLDKFEIRKFFQETEINWGVKSESIKKIAKKLNIPFDQILFVDDDPFQRAEVESSIPGIKAISVSDPIDILAHEGVLPKNPTAEDLERVNILKQQRDREVAEKSHADDYKEFLKSCSIKMTVRQIAEKDWSRVVQLINRTNEMNATASRTTLDELKKVAANKGRIFVSDLTDKFGDYGLIAVAVVESSKNEWLIRDLVVSCRTMGRGIGGALVIEILKAAKASGIQKVNGFINNTESNWRMKPLFEKRGFEKVGDEGSVVRYSFDLNKEKIVSHQPWLGITVLN